MAEVGMRFAVQAVQPVTRLEHDIQLLVILLKNPTIHSHYPEAFGIRSYREQVVQYVGLEQIEQNAGQVTEDPRTMMKPA